MIVATPVLLDDHTPPGVRLLNVVVAPWQTFNEPVIELGNGFTAIDILMLQPVGTVYIIVALPIALPVTSPDAFTLAIPGADELHVPPLTLLVNIVVEPIHTCDAPPIAGGVAFTFAVRVR